VCVCVCVSLSGIWCRSNPLKLQWGGRRYQTKKKGRQTTSTSITCWKYRGLAHKHH